MLAVGPAHSDFALLDTRLKSTASHVPFYSLSGRGDVKFEDIHGKAEGGASVGNVDDASDVALDRSAGEEKIDLII